MGPDPRRRIPSLGQPVPAQPGNEWESLKGKWDIDRGEFQQQVATAPPEAAAIVRQGLETAAPTAAPVAPPKTLDSMGPNVPSFDNSSVPDFKSARGGFAGATTDAEAQRNLQSRMEQDQAADYMVGRYNKAIESMRDTRAMNRGIGRGALDSQEGMDSAQAREYQARQPAASPDFGQRDEFLKKQQELLAKAEGTSGFGTRRKRDSLVAQANQYGQMAELSSQGALGVFGKTMDSQNEQAKSLNDLAARNQMTPYQQQSLGIQRQQLDAAQGQKQVKKLEDLGGDLAKDPRYQSYTAAKDYRAMLDEQYNSKNPADHARMAMTVMQLARPASEPNDAGIKLLEQSTGDLSDRILGPIKQAFGFSRYSDGQRQRLYETGQGSFDAKSSEGYAAINDVVQRVQAKGGNPADYLKPSDLQFWQDRQGQQQRGSSPKGSASAAGYKWDGEKLIPVQ